MYQDQPKYVYFLRAAFLFLWAVVYSISLPAQVRTTFPDSVTVVASQAYGHPSFLRKFLMGKNYRREWETPVTMHLFNLEQSGLEIKELGGGRQTKSLRLLGRDSVEWALRTVDKDVRPAIPKLIRNRLTISVVQDMVSAAHPFAPLTIPPLAAAVGVQAAQPEFYFVPDDTAFGKYRNLFAGRVCLLEKRDLLPGVKSVNTEKMLTGLFENPDNKLDQFAYLKARLLDMLIADWDRHYDQWKWAKLDSGKRTTYLALPKDRDQAYFYSKGWLLRFIRLFAMKFSVGFTNETTNLVKLNRVAWALDRLLLNGLAGKDWQQTANEFQHHLTDETITNAVKNLPPALYEISGQAITQKLLKRKATIGKDVMRYYNFLARDVTVYGTDKAEHFFIAGNEDSVVVTIFATDNMHETTYRRAFYAGETKAVHLFGLGGDDMFDFASGLETNITVAIDGGTGNNRYNLGGTSRVKANDSNLDAGLYLKQLRKPLRIRDSD